MLLLAAVLAAAFFLAAGFLAAAFLAAFFGAAFFAAAFLGAAFFAAFFAFATSFPPINGKHWKESFLLNDNSHTLPSYFLPKPRKPALTQSLQRWPPLLAN